jgi:alkanesulfonate monooxygenase SsuD/methylene tetrahydromethanopterin reductase-like flavin-dependent oxidoreductase (luciferase family)
LGATGFGDSELSMFEKPERSSDTPEGCVRATVEFTPEESEAITAGMNEYAAIWAGQHGGGGFITPVKVRDSMMAKALTEYVEDLLESPEECESEAEARTVIHKATQAQAKAYAMHNLPVYLFQLAGIFAFSGDATRSRDFFRNFLRANDEFRPDQIDLLFLRLGGFDMPTLLEVAKVKSR